MTYDYEGKNCAVTGGGGFLGQNIVAELIRDGAEVTVVDNYSYGSKPEYVHDEATPIEGDVRDARTFQRLPNVEYDYLFHFGAPSSVVAFEDDLNECIDITVTGFMNAMNWAVENGARFVYPSSGSLYSGARRPHSEDTDLNPKSMNPYAKTKRSLELIQQAHGHELDAVGLRIFAGYGPSERQKGGLASVINLFAADILNGERPMVFGDGSQERDFIYETDVARATLAIGENADEPVVNIGTGSPVSFNGLIEAINAEAGTDIEPECAEAPDDYLEKTDADTTTMERYYSPETSINEGISAVVDALR